MNNKINRSICIFLIFTILLVPFSRPKKANASLVVGIGVAAVTVVGSVILLLAGMSYSDSYSREAEARRLFEEHGDKIEFHFKGAAGDTWVTGDKIMLWDTWDGNWRYKEDFPNALDNFVANTPVAGTSIVQMPYEVIEVPWRGSAGYNVQVIEEGSKPVLNCNGSNVDFKNANFQIINMDFYINPVRCTTSVWDKPGDGSVFNIIVAGKEFTTIQTGSSVTIKAGNSNTVITKDYTLDYTSVVDDAYSKDRFISTFPANTSIDVSNVDAKTLPNVIAKDDVIPGVSVDTDTTVITGWKWLDNILEKILSAIRSIPSAIVGGIEALFIPTLSLSDVASMIYKKFNIPIIDFPNFSTSKPFVLDYDISSVLPGFKIYKVLDWEIFSYLRTLSLGLEVFCLIYFFGKKISALHGGGES